jgi:hypothetical protein
MPGVDHVRRAGGQVDAHGQRGDELLPAELRVQHPVRLPKLVRERQAGTPGIAQRGDRQRPEQAGPQPVAHRVDHRDEQLVGAGRIVEQVAADLIRRDQLTGRAEPN